MRILVWLVLLGGPAHADDDLGDFPLKQPAGTRDTSGIGTVKIAQVDPAGAEVMFDGRVVGKVPVTLTTRTGKHELRVARAGFKVWTSQVEVSAGESTKILLVLDKLARGAAAPPKPALARLSVDADVRGADVWIDDTLAGKTPLRAQLAPGTHRIAIDSPRHQRATATVQLFTNKLASLKLGLEPRRPGVTDQGTPIDDDLP